MTLLADLVAASGEVSETSSRSRKVAILAELLRRLESGEIAAAVGFLAGVPRQGRVGIGYATIYGIDAPPASSASLAIADLDRAITEVEATSGTGSAAERTRILSEPARARDGARGRLHQAPVHRRDAPGRARGPDGRCGREGSGPAGRADPPRADALRRSDAHGRDRRDRGRGGAAGGGIGDLPPDLPDARVHRERRRRSGRELRAVIGRVEARRDPDPGPPPRRRGPHLHPQPERDHGDTPRGRRRGRLAPGAAGGPRRRGAVDARGGPGGLPGHRLAESTARRCRRGSRRSSSTSSTSTARTCSTRRSPSAPHGSTRSRRSSGSRA